MSPPPLNIATYTSLNYLNTSSTAVPLSPFEMCFHDSFQIHTGLFVLHAPVHTEPMIFIKNKGSNKTGK